MSEFAHRCDTCGSRCGCFCSGCSGMSCCHFTTAECRILTGDDELEDLDDDYDEEYV